MTRPAFRSLRPAGMPPGRETQPRNPLREVIVLAILLLACLVAVVVVFKPDFDPDIWSRLAVGKLVLESGSVTTADPFSYTPKRDLWIDHEWGAGVLFYALASQGGQRALIASKGLILFGTLLFVYLRSRRNGSGAVPSLAFHLALVGGFYLGFVATIRAQAFTYLFFSMWLWALEETQAGNTKAAWLIPLTGLLWPNLHGGFLAGVALVFVHLAAAIVSRKPVRTLAAVALTTVLASLVNPYGLKYWTYLVDAVTMSRSGISEWRALNLLDLHPAFLGFKILLALTVFFLLVRTAEDDVPDVPTLLTLLVTAVVGLRVERHTTFFVIAAAPFIHTSLATRWTRFVGGPAAARRLEMSPVTQSVVFGLGHGVLLLVLVSILSVAPARVSFIRVVPVRAVDFIQQNGLEGNLLVPFNFGSYATWRLYPKCKVSMDGRYETVYLDSTYEAVRDFFLGRPGWNQFLDAQRHDVILESPRNVAVEANLASRADWKVAYQDEISRVYVRSELVRSWAAPSPAPRTVDPFSPAEMPRYPR